MIRTPKPYLCKDCSDSGWLLYKKQAPSPPYKEGITLDYGVYCNLCEKGRSMGGLDRV
jgi:hypothetical protein